MEVQVVVVIIDLEHDGRAIKIERTKVVLAMWIVGGAEIVKSRDGLNQPLDASGPRAATPGVITAPPPRRCWRSSSLSARILSVSVDMVLSPF